jgi:flagellar motor switch protein FliN/FliY
MAEPSQPVGQDEIDALLRQSQAGGADPTAAPAAGSAAGGVSQDDIELLLQKAEQALASIDEPVGGLPPNVKSFNFADFSGAAPNTESATLELMRDVELDLTIELGRTHMHLEDVLKLKQGAVVPLDKLAGDPADIYVNGRLIARGEVLVLNDNFCVRVAELIVGESACA